MLLPQRCGPNPMQTCYHSSKFRCYSSIKPLDGSTSSSNNNTSSSTSSSSSSSTITFQSVSPIQEAQGDFKDFLSEANRASTSINSLISKIESQRDWPTLKSELDSINDSLKSDTLWTENASEAISLQRKCAQLNQSVSEYESFKQRVEEGKSMLEMAHEVGNSDIELVKEVVQDLTLVLSDLEKYSLRMLM